MVDAVKAIIVCSVIFLAIVFGFCCHFLSRNRRDEELASRSSGARNSRAMQQTEVGNTNQNNMGPVFVIGLHGRGLNSNARETRSHSGEDQTSENQPDETPRSADPIVESGPPPYGCLTTSDEAPPPSYEDALRVSTEHLAATRHQHIV